MLSALLKFELKYHFVQITFIIAGVLFFALGCFSAMQGGFGGNGVQRNAPYVVTNIVALFSLLTIFAATLFSANVVLRDSIYKLDSVLYTTSIAKKTYFFVRFLGLLIAVFALLVFTATGIFCGSFFVNGGEVGTTKFINYLHPLVVFGLPNVLLVCSLIFSTAVLTKNVRAIYVTGVLLYILYMAASILGNSPLLASSVKVSDPSILPFLIDPFGLASFFSETRNWTDLQRNHQLFPVESTFLINRLLWLGVSAAVIAIAYRFFNFRLAKQSQSKTKAEIKTPISVIPFRHFSVFPAGSFYNFTVFKSQFKLEVISLFKHIPFMVMLLLWIFLFGIELKDSILHGPYSIKYFPTTGAIIEEMRSMKFALILLVFYSAELIAREKTANIQSLIYSTPVKNIALWSAKCLTLMVLVLVLVTANIAIGITVQLFNGYYNFEIPKYLSLYYYSALPLFLFVVLIVFIQNLASNKYMGMMLSIVVVFAISFASKLGVEHYLLRFATVPELQFSNFNNFGHYAKAFNWYMLYWLGFTSLIAVLTIGMWQTSLQLSFLDRLKLLPKALKKSKFIMVIGLIVWLSCGVFIYQQTNVVGRYMNKNASLNWNIDYEKKYRAFQELPQPIIKSVRTKVDLFPKENRYSVTGTYILKNESNKPIKRIWIALNKAVNKFTIDIPNAVKIELDEDFNQQLIDLKQVLLPGEEEEMNFAVSVNRSGFTDFDSENSVVSNGTYVEMEKFLPHFGYNPNLEIDDARLRKKEGLPLYQIPSSNDRNYHLIDFESTISTEADQQVVTVGTLKKSWTANGRTYFHYKTEAPINFMFALSSAKYQLKKENYKGVELRVYYHLGHEYNVNTMFSAIKDALDYGNSNFGQYPLKQFSLAEIPQYKGAATAYPGVVFNAERINYLTNYSDKNLVNQSYAITAHEVAHQWWANILAPANGPGYATLTESLAKYTEAVLLEKKIGKMLLRNYLADDNRLYFVYKNPNEEEFPLVKTYGQNNVHYQKGGLVMYAVKELLGEQIFNKTLKDLVTKHAYPNQRAKATDLLNALLAVSDKEHQPFINESFKDVVNYEMAIKILSCKPLSNGKFSVDLQVNIGKHKQGEAKLLAPDMDVDLAFFNQPQLDLDKDTKPFYIKKYRFNKLATTVNVITDHKPKTIAIDPYAYLLDANLKDNFQELK